ncbi:MAG: hypothetical protein M1825_001940 [Sarcosagium campestre]|nr:MAG: hypothetical protein M1825_001940 [Sarcosagium campestre]
MRSRTESRPISRANFGRSSGRSSARRSGIWFPMIIREGLRKEIGDQVRDDIQHELPEKARRDEARQRLPMRRKQPRPQYYTSRGVQAAACLNERTFKVETGLPKSYIKLVRNLPKWICERNAAPNETEVEFARYLVSVKGDGRNYETWAPLIEFCYKRSVKDGASDPLPDRDEEDDFAA